MANTFIHLPPTGSSAASASPVEVIVNANADSIEIRNQPLALLLDDTTTANNTYVGEAAVGASTAASTWRIKRINETSGIVLQWADGNGNFDNIWDNRTSLTYS